MKNPDKPLSILLVEDNRAMSAVIIELLSHTQLSLSVTSTDSGQGALDQLNANRFDCVLLDYELPDYNANEVLKRLQGKRQLSMPIIILTGHSQAKLANDVLALGAIDFITKSECSPEKLKRAITYAISRNQFRISQADEEKAQISRLLDTATAETAHLLNYDRLTQLPNRELFKVYLNKSIARACRHQLNVCLLYIDIDNFKCINDSLGHDLGDKALISFCHRLQSIIRSNDALCRVGEDEFAIYLDFIENECDAAIVAEKIIRLTGIPIEIDNHDIYLYCSIGICYHSNYTGDSETLLSNAQTAMLSVKKNGKNSFVYFSNEMTTKAQKRLYLEQEVRLALANDDFHMVYQPKIDVKTQRITGAEALIRWHHPKNGVIPPNEFIPVAEQSDLILKLDSYILDKVINQISRWQKEGLEVPVISVNIPSREFQRGDLVTSVQDTLRKYQVAGNRFEIEITERLLMDHCEDNIKILNRLKDLEIHISVDDFGTGYSSLSYLVQFPCDVLKIDKSFIDQLPQSKDNCKIVEAIIMLAHKLGKSVVAEGVETEVQYQYLSALGCDQIQGYYFYKPLNKNDFSFILDKVQFKGFTNVSQIKAC
ncbi:EAL domain-containing protein [Shewanella benthica]|nr:EAL domain-containing protein [Shewanella benthica]